MSQEHTGGKADPESGLMSLHCVMADKVLCEIKKEHSSVSSLQCFDLSRGWSDRVRCLNMAMGTREEQLKL